MNRLTAGLLATKLWAPDEGQGEGAPAAPAPESSSLPEQAGLPAEGGATPTAPPESAAAPAAPEFDYRRGYEELSSHQQQLFRELQAANQRQQQQWNQIGDFLRQTFDPKGYEQSKQQPPLTRDEIRGMFEQYQRQQQQQAMTERLRQELPQLAKEFPLLASEKAKKLVVNHWINGGTPSLLDAAREVNEFLQGTLTEEQKRWAAGKVQQKEELRGSGAPAGAPPPAARPQQNGARGLERLRSVELTAEDLKA